MDPVIQQAIDDVTATKDLEKAAMAALAAQGTQITALQASVDDLSAKLAAGGAISADDVATLKAKLAELEQSNTEFKTAIPAGT